jgi:hypothetical protein
MHRNNHRHRNSIGGLVTFLLLLLGVFIFFGMFTDIVSHIFWPFPTVGILIFILIIYSISSSRRRRVRQRPVQYQKYQRHQQYQPTENPYWKNQEKDFIPSQKVEQMVRNEPVFCNYCGVKIEEKANFCVNCGRKLD